MKDWSQSQTQGLNHLRVKTFHYYYYKFFNANINRV